MTAAVESRSDADRTQAGFIARSALKLGLLESVIVLLFSLVSRRMDGTVATVLEAVLVSLGLAAVTILPGLWTRARTIEGIAGAAGIGLAATVVFLLVDVSILQPIGTYSHRWRDIGGGSNWWYHPVWWMVGTYLPWMGAWILANQTAKSGSPSVPGLLISSVALTVVSAAAGILLRVPLAGWNLPTVAIAFLPGLALATIVSLMGARRG